MFARRDCPGGKRVSTVAEWLASLGLSEHTQLFADNDIDPDVLPELTDQDLEKLGVSLGHRRRMLRAIREIGKAPAPASMQPPPPSIAVGPGPQDTAERRQLTVMFVDLVGSTSLSTRLDPEDLRGIINAYHRCCTELVQRNSGFVAKYMGDGVLAYFGYPRADEHDAERAARAGLALVEAVPKLVTIAGSPLQVRVGIATGLVVVGDLIGTGAAQEQAVVGETPNLAARLQSLAEPGAVVISATTRQLTGGMFEYRDLGPVALKGFGEGTLAWQVTGASAAESRFEALRASTTPLVGRDEEIELLMRRWERAKRGEGHVVLIAGEPGIGKSRIAQTIVERVSAEPHTRLRHFCSPHHQDSALYPIIAQLERAAGLRRLDAPEQRLAKLEAVLAQGTDDLSEVLLLFADLLSIPTGDRHAPLTLTPQKRKEKTLHAQLTLVEGLAARQPVLIVFEDVHWSDPTTREVLDLLVDRVATLRVLVILTFRPEFSPPWVGRPQVMLLTLGRLPPRERAQMIGYMTGGKAFPKQVADQIVDRTDGVPLFIEELTKTIVESGIVAEAGDHYELTGPATPLTIPTSLHASLLARLDRLAPTREIAQIGAALGRSFSHELISAVAQMPQPQVDDALRQLVSAELIFCRGTPPDAEYTFKHALVQDAAYGTLLRGRRQHIHASIVAALERHFPDIAATQPQLIAQHCAQAGLIEQSIGYWLKAGQQSVARSAMAEAVAQLTKGLELLGALHDDDRCQQQELDLRIALGPALIATKGYAANDVGDTITRARALAAQLNRQEYVVPLLYGQWGFHFIRSEHLLALSCSEQMERIGELQQNTAVRLMGCLYQAIVRQTLGEFETARSLLRQCSSLKTPAYRASAIAMTAEDPYLMTLSWLAASLATLGYVDQARVAISEALSAVEALDQAHTQAYSHCFVLIFACGTEWNGQSAEAVKQYADKLVALAEEHGFPYLWTCGLSYAGWSRIALGQPQEGLDLLNKGLSTNRAIGAAWGTAWYFVWQAQAYRMVGQANTAKTLLDEAQQLMERTGERFMEAELVMARAALAADAGDRVSAESGYREALATARRQHARMFELSAATSLARLWRDQGRRTEAHDLLAPVYGWFTEGFDTPVLKEAKALLEQLSV
jgi:class 3 adenylate cyclase/predicted ATPase